MSTSYDIVLFGGDGDLSLRKLMPALYRASVNQELAPGMRIITTKRNTSFDNDAFVERIHNGLEKQLPAREFNPGQWQVFRNRIQAHTMDVTDLDKGWSELKQILSESDNHVLFYFSLPPSIYAKACENMSAAGLIDEHTRVIVEKPIGYDRASAENINEAIGKYFPEPNIYRIDHYLGKETVQNLMVLRFSNYLFEDLWDHKSIDHVQITLAETVGLEGRAGFYDGAGAVRDMVQNHLLQLLCLVAMEPVSHMVAEDIRAEKIKVLRALKPIVGDEVFDNAVRGQYAAGVVDGEERQGYLEELGKDSKTETFVAIRAHIDNWRWSGVPFYLRTGKSLHQRFSEIVIQFKPVSHRAFADKSGPMSSNKLIVRLQPDENIELQLMTKDMDRNDIHLQKMSLNLNQGVSSMTANRDAYKRLLLDALRGDSSLFIHRDEVDASWRWLDPMLDAWKESDHKPHQYAAGTWGPVEADELIGRDGFKWRNEKKNLGA